MALVGFRAPALPLPPGQYSAQQQSELVRALRLYFNLIDSLTPQQAQSYRAENFFGGTFTGSGFQGGTLFGFGRGLEVPYAMLMSDQDQSSAGTTSENIVTYNRIIFSDGINVENNSRITFSYPGQYLVTVSLQVTNRSNAVREIELWAKNTGVNYPLSNTRFDVPERKSVGVWGHAVAAVSGIFTVTNGEYLEMAWWSNSNDVYLEHYPVGTNPTRPEIPSVILTVQFVSALPARFVPTSPARVVVQGYVPLVAVQGLPKPGTTDLQIQGYAPTISIA
jgi:hypothetical protein